MVCIAIKNIVVSSCYVKKDMVIFLRHGQKIVSFTVLTPTD